MVDCGRDVLRRAFGGGDTLRTGDILRAGDALRDGDAFRAGDAFRDGETRLVGDALRAGDVRPLDLGDASMPAPPLLPRLPSIFRSMVFT